jgi:hypothetical protein
MPEAYLQMDIIKRFMSEDEISDLLEKYQSGKLRTAAQSREESLNKPLDFREKKLLREYLINLDKSINEFAKEAETSRNTFKNRMGDLALRYVFSEMQKNNS